MIETRRPAVQDEKAGGKAVVKPLEQNAELKKKEGETWKKTPWRESNPRPSPR